MNSLRVIMSVFSALFGIGCAGIGFESAWEESVADYCCGKIDDPVAGPWEGTWRTETNGHEGKLRCLVTPTGEKDNYDFRYHATWRRILRGGYKVNYDVEKVRGGYSVEGTRNLGLFGEFYHDGMIRGKRFDADYESGRGDVGRFEMARPQ